ncbi:MAG: hypothetical protein DSY40_00395 [Nautilia sp.]|nr:MAG: hypothetical protein DSY40_00395 [Nautilia sp.]
MDALKTAFLNPIKSFKLRYLPLLMIYFAYGMSGFSSIAETFWVKEHLNLTAEALVSLGVWLSIPWTIKMVFGQLVDSVALLGSQRRVYVYIGAGLIALSTILMIGLVGNYEWIKFASIEKVYILASVIGVIGFVLQDVVADTMSTEVVDRNQPQEIVEQELAMVQVLGRLALSIAGFMVAGVGGWLAQIFSYETIFKISLIVPLISVIGVTIVKLDIAKPSPINCKILCGGLLFAIFVVVMGYSNLDYSQEIVFIVSFIVISYMIKGLIDDLDYETKRKIIVATIVIFVYRAMPGVGPGVTWWEIDILHFDKAFFGTLAQIGSGLAILGMWFLSDWITKKPISWTLIMLTIVGTILSLPIVGMYYGLHHWTEEVFGFGAKTIALIDTAAESPFSQLSMIPLLTLIAIYAPEGKRATWFALMASMMNLALTAGGLFTKYLNKIFVVSREVIQNGVVISHSDYSQLGKLLILVTSINFIIPIFIIWLLMIKKDTD